MNKKENNRIEVPTEGWDEDIREDYKSPKYYLWGFVRTVVVLLVLAGLLYLSGIYQSTFFSRTSPKIKPQELPVLVEGQREVLPLTVINLVEKDRKNVQSRREIEGMVEKASRIWDQARIDLELQNYSTVYLENRELLEFIKNPYNLARRMSLPDREGVVVFLVHSLGGINGVAFVGGDTIALAEYTSVYNFRVLAHEVGHILGLPHIEEAGRLMSREASGSKLISPEAERARRELDSLK